MRSQCPLSVERDKKTGNVLFYFPGGTNVAGPDEGTRWLLRLQAEVAKALVLPKRGKS